jgi:hypothetical protein
MIAAQALLLRNQAMLAPDATARCHDARLVVSSRGLRALLASYVRGEWTL